MPKNYCIMQIWAESGKSALPICNYSQILYQFLTFTQNLKWSQILFLLIHRKRHKAKSLSTLFYAFSLNFYLIVSASSIVLASTPLARICSGFLHFADAKPLLQEDFALPYALPYDLPHVCHQQMIFHYIL